MGVLVYVGVVGWVGVVLFFGYGIIGRFFVGKYVVLDRISGLGCFGFELVGVFGCFGIFLFYLLWVLFNFCINFFLLIK